MSNFYDELEFPRRAEYLDEYKHYKVEITHWKDLCLQLGKQFRTVYQTRSAAVILVHGPMSSGKSLFCKRLLEDYHLTSKGDPARDTPLPPQCKPDLQSNLWHALIAAPEPSEEQIREATQNARVSQVSGADLRKIRETPPDENVRVRVFLLDDAHKDPMVRPWTDMEVTDFYESRQRAPDAIIARVAQDIDTACRNHMRRSVIVMFSNDRQWLEDLKGHLDKCFGELPTLVDMPNPCELTQAAPKSNSDKDIDKAIADAMLRTGHAIEITAFLDDKLAKLDDYLSEKIVNYAGMLESV